jgi:hypothetical protein
MAKELESPSVSASVVYLRMHEAGNPRAAEHLAEATRQAAALWRSDARVVLDATDGSAIVGLGDPRVALQAAHGAAADGELRVGLHHGPVQLSTSVDGEPARLQGEGISGAELAARQANEALAHETAAFQIALANAASQRRRRMVIGLASVAGVLGLGVAARLTLQRIEAARKPAVISLAIQPSGEVYVDGDLKGTSPPLNRMWIAPGAHTIEVRNGRFKPLRMELQLQPGEEMELKHVFGAPPRKPGLVDRFKFW